ncbi:hypothetical protein TrVE_jg399 [Triparma verrucosa]|nr:hypothetical protein TrVE_jg399 [Triparma verrucosa]
MGMVINAAPIYIKGIKDPEAASNTCYWGAGCYAATFGISVALLVKERAMGRRDSLEDASDAYGQFGADGKQRLVANRAGAGGYGTH